ncbi:hypothetical protein BGX27_008176 [Mortierella sp. AM989]|nr:hypothetical protein BGX27_008176 [Mortierella sp. AM989]
MRIPLARHCQQCLAIVKRTVLTGASHKAQLETRLSRVQAAPAVSSSLQYQQIREAFLRAGPGRNLGSTLRRSPQSSASLQSSHPELISTDELDQPENENDPDSTAESPTITEALPSPPKRASAEYKEIVLLETDFRERFIKGGGNGGQKINKTNSNVELKHFETGIVVQCQATRSLPQNRKLARRILTDRLDEYYNGDMSKRGKKAEKIRQRKMRMARKSAKKYHGASTESSTVDLEEEDNYDDYVDDKGDDNHEEVIANNKESSTKAKAKSKVQQVPETTIQLTTLEEIIASNNKKPSRRKAGRKE